jgi:hypothetical protein
MGKLLKAEKVYQVLKKLIAVTYALDMQELAFHKCNEDSNLL